MFHLSTTQPDKPKKLPWIQVLRAVAALMVLFFHLGPHWNVAPYLGGFVQWTKWGFCGVDVFFVLSGFVVYRSAKAALHDNVGVFNFIWKRFSRIYFGYWPVFVLAVAIARLTSLREWLPGHEMIGSFFLLYPNTSKNWIPTAWSLSFELMFYSWITLFVFFRRNSVRAIVLAILVLVLWNSGWLALARDLVYGGQQAARYLLTGFGIEFLLGALIFELYDKKRWLFQDFFVVSTLSLSVMVMALTAGTVSAWFDRVEILRVATFGIFGASCLVLALAVGETKLRPPAFLVRIGDASYSMYLLHPFLLSLSGLVRARLVVDSSIQGTVFMIFLPVVIVLIAQEWFDVVESRGIRLSESVSQMVLNPRQRI